MTTTFSAKMQELQKSQLEKLVSLHERENGPASFIEIGCGDGSFMKYALRSIPRVIGVEPSRRFANEAMEAGFEVLIGYVGSKILLTDEKFDCFVSRQVFEHLPDPLDVLIGIRNMLHPGAVGLIEVPNGQRALRLKRFFEFFPDHVNYYSVNSLVALASSAKLNVVGCHEAFGGDYLELWVRYEPDAKDWFCNMAKHRDLVCSALASHIATLTAQQKRVAIWGCGAKALSILSSSTSASSWAIACVIDSDPHKQGKFVPNTAIPVVSLSEAVQLQPDVVIVLALSYRDEIAATVRQSIPTCRSILTLNDYGIIVEL